MAESAPKDPAPIVVPTIEKEQVKAPAEDKASRKFSTVKPSLLDYMKEISGGGRPLSDEQWLEIRDNLKLKDEKGEKNKVGLNVLLDYMTRRDSNAMRPLGESELDLTRPLSSYFISSSHNTYLSGNQLYGDASAEVYKNV